MKKAKKRGRKLGVKVGPYKIITLHQLHLDIQAINKKLAKLERVLR
jgi:hypothetical protein